VLVVGGDCNSVPRGDPETWFPDSIATITARTRPSRRSASSHLREVIPLDQYRTREQTTFTYRRTHRPALDYLFANEQMEV